MPEENETPVETGGGGDTRAVDDWAKERFPSGANGAPSAELWRHYAADALHGWSRHAYEANEPFKVGQADYDAALEAAVTLKPLEGAPGAMTYLPHEPARSPYAPVIPKPTVEGG